MNEVVFENRMEKLLDTKIVLLLASMLILMVASLFFAPLVYLWLILATVSVFLVSPKQIFCILLFTFPYAVILKMGSSGTSLFTLLEVITIVILLVEMRKYNGIVLILSALLTMIAILDVDGWLSVIKLLNIVLLYYLFTIYYRAEDSSSYFKCFFFGMLTSTCLGFFKESIPRLTNFYNDLNYEWIDGNETIRFSGLYNDPNYFSVPVILCLMLGMISLMNPKQKNKIIWSLLSLVMLLFGCLTLSKSFYLTALFVLLMIVCFSNIKHRVLTILLMLFGIGILILINPFNVIENIFFRFENSDLTTGRTEIWGDYIEKIKSSTFSFLFGNGIGSPYVNRPAHNTYIETVYYIGIIGTLLYLTILIYITVCNRRFLKRGIVNYLGFGALTVLYVFLCGLTAYEFPFYLMVCYILFNCNLKEKESILGIRRNKQNG